MLASGTFSCGDGGRGHVAFWDIFLWDPRPLGLLFGAFRLSEIRNSFVNGFICSERTKSHYLITRGGLLARANGHFE